MSLRLGIQISGTRGHSAALRAIELRRKHQEHPRQGRDSTRAKQNAARRIEATSRAGNRVMTLKAILLSIVAAVVIVVVLLATLTLESQPMRTTEQHSISGEVTR
jgi:Flp pilus assembly protein TadB